MDAIWNRIIKALSHLSRFLSKFLFKSAKFFLRCVHLFFSQESFFFFASPSRSFDSCRHQFRLLLSTLTPTIVLAICRHLTVPRGANAALGQKCMLKHKTIQLSSVRSRKQRLMHSKLPIKETVIHCSAQSPFR